MTNSNLRSDKELTIALKKGERTAFTEIYDKYWKDLYQVAYNILQDPDAAEDALQDIFLSLWQRRSTVDIISLKPYLHQALKFSVFKMIRAQKTYQQFFERLAEVTTEILTENPLLFKEEQYLIQNLLDNLPANYRETFRLSREENMTYKQIAAYLNVSEKTVEKRISAALKLIRKGLSLELCLAIILLYHQSSLC